MYTATSRTARFASLTFAVFMAVAINGSMLMKFDSLATSDTLAQSASGPTVVALKTVTIVGRRS